MGVPEVHCSLVVLYRVCPCIACTIVRKFNPGQNLTHNKYCLAWVAAPGSPKCKEITETPTEALRMLQRMPKSRFKQDFLSRILGREGDSPHIIAGLGQEGCKKARLP